MPAVQRGLSSRSTSEGPGQPGDWRGAYHLPRRLRNTRRRCPPKRKDRPTIGSPSCTTRCTTETCWDGPTLAVVPTAAHRGVDGQTFEDLDAYGRNRWLDEWADDLRKRMDCPRPVRRVYISKPDGKQRPLGISGIKDRVAQRATVLVWEPIFEADLEPEQYGYRPGRRALDTVRQVERLVRSGHTEVVDGDLSGSSDAIPHVELRKSLSRRISDRFVLKLIKRWREAPVEETDARGTAIGRPGTRTRDAGASRVLR